MASPAHSRIPRFCPYCGGSTVGGSKRACSCPPPAPGKGSKINKKPHKKLLWMLVKFAPAILAGLTVAGMIARSPLPPQRLINLIAPFAIMAIILVGGLGMIGFKTKDIGKMIPKSVKSYLAKSTVAFLLAYLAGRVLLIF